MKLPASRWTVLQPDEAKVITEDDERTLSVRKDGAIASGSQDPLRSRYQVKAAIEMSAVTGFRVEALIDPGKKVGRSKSGDFALAEFSVMAQAPGAAPRKLELAVARADFAAKSGPAEKAIDGDSTTGWSVGPQVDQPHVIVFELKAPQDFPAGTTLTVELEHRIVGLMTRFRIATTTSAPPLDPSTIPDAILTILDTPSASRTEAAKTELARYFAQTADDKRSEFFAPLTAHLAKKPEAPKTTAATLTVKERRTHIHLRGDYERPGDEVQPGTLAVLPPLQGARPPSPTASTSPAGSSIPRTR